MERLKGELELAEQKAELLETNNNNVEQFISGNEEKLAQMSSDQIVDRAKGVQGKSKESLQRTLKTIEDTKGVAADTMVELHDQTSRIRKAQEGVDEVEANLTEAGKQLRSFVRRVATDKIIMGFMFIIVVLIVFVVVWSIIHKHSKANVPDEFKPQTSQPTA